MSNWVLKRFPAGKIHGEREENELISHSPALTHTHTHIHTPQRRRSPRTTHSVLICNKITPQTLSEDLKDGGPSGYAPLFLHHNILIRTSLVVFIRVRDSLTCHKLAHYHFNVFQNGRSINGADKGRKGKVGKTIPYS